MKVKICGIKTAKDAILAYKLGADAIGLLVGQEYASPDFIDIIKAKEIVQSLPEEYIKVLVTHIMDPEIIIDIIDKTGVNAVQFHSDITVDEITKIKNRFPEITTIRAVNVENDASVSEVEKYAKVTDMILLDTINHITNQVGGTGLTHNWAIDKKIIEQTDAKIIIAGGLDEHNVAEAIRTSRPYGVDVNTGVDSGNKDGSKNYNKMSAFINNAKKTLV